MVHSTSWTDAQSVGPELDHLPNSTLYSQRLVCRVMSPRDTNNAPWQRHLQRRPRQAGHQITSTRCTRIPHSNRCTQILRSSARYSIHLRNLLIDMTPVSAHHTQLSAQTLFSRTQELMTPMAGGSPTSLPTSCRATIWPPLMKKHHQTQPQPHISQHLLRAKRHHRDSCLRPRNRWGICQWPLLPCQHPRCFPYRLRPRTLWAWLLLEHQLLN